MNDYRSHELGKRVQVCLHSNFHQHRLNRPSMSYHWDVTEQRLHTRMTGTERASPPAESYQHAWEFLKPLMEGACPTHIQAMIDHLDGLKEDSPILHTQSIGEATEVLNNELKDSRRDIRRAISSDVSQWIAQYNEANPSNRVIVTPSYGYKCLSSDRQGNTFPSEVSLNYLLSISGVSLGPTMTCSQSVLVTVYRIGRGTSQAGSGFTDGEPSGSSEPSYSGSQLHGISDYGVSVVKSYCSPTPVSCSQNNRPHGTIKHIHSSHLSFCSRLAICDHHRKLRPQSQLCDYCGCILQSQLATLVASRPSQINIYIRPFWSDFLIPSCIFYLHANYTTVINSISNKCSV